MRNDYGKIRTQLQVSSVWYRIGRTDVFITIDFEQGTVAVNHPKRRVVETLDEYDKFEGTLKQYAEHVIKRKGG